MTSTDSPDNARTPHQIKTLARSAKALVNNGNIADAKHIYLKILEIAPFHGAALSFFAQSAYKDGDLEKALALMDKAIQGSPRNPRHFQNRAEIYKAMGRPDDAIRDLDQVQLLLPDFPMPLFDKALMLKASGKWDDAVRTAISAWQQEPGLEAVANDESLPQSVRDKIIECANLIRSTLLIMIDAELDPIIKDHGKPPCQRIFDAVAAFTGLDTLKDEYGATVRSFMLASLPAFTAEMASGWINMLEQRYPSIQNLIGLMNIPSQAGVIGVIRHDIRTMTGSSTYQTLMPDLDVLPVIPEPDGNVNLLIAASGSHLLNRAGGENWKLIAYLPIEIPDKALLVLDQQETRPVSGKLIIGDATHNHYLHLGANTTARFLCFHVWHPGLTAVEISGIQAVFRAIRKFDTRYRQLQAA